MNLPGLSTVQPEQTELLDELAHMVGTCFREELWYATWLDVPDLSEERRLEITRASLRADYAATAPYGCVYTLDDRAGAANVFLRSELDGRSWPELEKQEEQAMAALLTAHEQEVLGPRAAALEPASDTNWPSERAGAEDYLYFVSIGVDPARRGSGAFGRLFRPFLTETDRRGICAYLDCYTDRLESLYGHYGFCTVERKGAPGFDLVERCMVREPRV